MTISANEFFNIPEVHNAQQAQRQNPWGSEAHRNAFITILTIGEQHGIRENLEENLGTLEDYDAAIVRAFMEKCAEIKKRNVVFLFQANSQ